MKSYVYHFLTSDILTTPTIIVLTLMIRLSSYMYPRRYGQVHHIYLFHHLSDRYNARSPSYSAGGGSEGARIR